MPRLSILQPQQISICTYVPITFDYDGATGCVKSHFLLYQNKLIICFIIYVIIYFKNIFLQIKVHKWFQINKISFFLYFDILLKKEKEDTFGSPCTRLWYSSDIRLLKEIHFSLAKEIHFLLVIEEIQNFWKNSISIVRRRVTHDVARARESWTATLCLPSCFVPKKSL